MTPWGWVADPGGGSGGTDPLSGFIYGGSDPYGTNPDYQPGQLPPLDPSGNPIWINLPPPVGTIDIGGGTGRIPSVGTGGTAPNTGIGSTGTTPHGPYPAKPGGGGGLIHWLAGLSNVPGLGPIPSGVGAGAQASVGGASAGSAALTGLEQFATSLLGKLGKGGGGGGQQGDTTSKGDAAKGGPGPVPVLAPPPQMSTIPPYIPAPTPTRPVQPGGSFDVGGTTTAPGFYQMDPNETVRTPEQEQQLQQMLAANFGGITGQSIQQASGGGLGGRAAGQGQMLEDISAQQAGPPSATGGGLIFQGGGGQIPQTPQLPQFGDPGSFPRIPGVPETGITPEQAMGPGRNPLVIPRAPYQSAFMDRGARTGYMVHNLLSDVSMGAQRFRQYEWDKKMQQAQAAAMGQIQQRMKAQQRQPGQIAGQQAPQQPDEVAQAIQKAMGETTDPKERAKLQKMLEARGKAREKEDSQWAKIFMKSQDPTTPEYAGVQRAYGMMRAMGEQSLQDELLKSRAQAAIWNAQSQYLYAAEAAQKAQSTAEIMKNMAPDIGILTGKTPPTPSAPGTLPGAGVAPGAAPGAPAGKAAVPIPKEAGGEPTKPAATAQPQPGQPITSPLQFLMQQAPLKPAQKAEYMAAIYEAAQTQTMKPIYTATAKIAGEQEKELKINYRDSPVVYDRNSPTKYSIWFVNDEGQPILDEKGQMRMQPVWPPARSEMMQIRQEKMQAADGHLYLVPATSLRNIPVGPDGKVDRTVPPTTHVPQGSVPVPQSAGGGFSAPTAPTPTPKPAGGTTPATTPPTTATALHGPHVAWASPTSVPSGFPHGTIDLGLAKIPDLSVGTLPRGGQMAGTLTQLRLAGVPEGSISKLPGNQLNIIASARSILDPLDPTAPPPYQAEPGYVPTGGLLAQADYVLRQFRPGELTWLNSRWEDWLANEVGAGADPRFIALHTLLNGLLGTAIMQSHVGARGGEHMMTHFEAMAHAGTMDQDTLRQAIATERQYTEGRALRPKIQVRVGNRTAWVPADRLEGFMNTYQKQGAQVVQ